MPKSGRRAKPGRAAGLGSAVEVGKRDGAQKRLQAAVVPFPCYDPDKSRVRL